MTLFVKRLQYSRLKGAFYRCFLTFAAAGLAISLQSCFTTDDFAAASRNNDQAALSRIALKSKDRQTRILAIKQLTDQETLSEIALEDPEKEIRLLAIENLHDQETLAGIITDPQVDDHEILLAAIKNTTDQPTLSDVVLGQGRWEKEDYNSHRVLAAIKNTTNQDTLAQVTLGQGRWSNLYGMEELEAAALNTTDPEILGEIALGRGTWHDLARQKNSQHVLIMATRTTIIERINDEGVLLEIALNDKNLDLRNRATARLKHQASWQRVKENLKGATGPRSTQAAMTELYLFAHDSIIQSHLPGLEVEYDVGVSSQSYSYFGNVQSRHIVRGESISITVRHSEEVLGTWELKTDFPYSLNSKEIVFIPASLDILHDVIHSICDKSSLSDEELTSFAKDSPLSFIRLSVRIYIGLLR